MLSGTRTYCSGYVWLVGQDRDSRPALPEISDHIILMARRTDDQVNESLPCVGDLTEKAHGAPLPTES